MNDKVSPSTEATEQQDAEPVAWMIEFSNRMGEPSRAVHLHNAVGDYREQFDSEAKATPLYAAPQAEEKHSHRGDDEPALAAPEAGKELEQYTGSAPAPKGWPTEAELTVDERGKTALKFVRLLSWAVAQGTQSDELSPKRQSLPARHLQRCAGQ